jgi:nitroimidazol reductase NimA-like FMN-containing flavoprotein (pyridoxamine 5'-phosphate oxidase superfamily)
VDGGRLYFASGKTGRKIRDLRANPQIAVSADDYTEAWGGSAASW